MGLTVHYKLRLASATARQAYTLVKRLHRRALALPLERVGPLATYSARNGLSAAPPWLGEEIECQAREERGRLVVPQRAIGFWVHPGPGSEPGRFGLLQYPWTIARPDGRGYHYLGPADRATHGRDAVIREVWELFTPGRSDMAHALTAWPALKARLLSEKDDGAGEIVAALRQVHIEQEKISTALKGLLMRGERLKIDDLKTVAQRLAGRESRDSAELAALLAVCESAGRNAGLRWRRVAG